MARKSRKETVVLPVPEIDTSCRAGVYVRLSVEDKHTHTASIETQQLIIARYLEQNPEIIVVQTYIDNGATGTNFHRPGFQQMLSDIEAGLINCVIVKDLSRLGRNVIDTGYYIERYFPMQKVRFMSIENQHLALNEFVSSMPESAHAEILEFIDNGYSGTNFERPKVQELIEMVRANKIDCIIVKDFSRFGRNSIETGYFIERVFPLFHTRFISINDDFDSDQHKGDTGGMDVAFKYLISEYYSRDMSIKTKSAKYAKMQRGEYQSKVCPYGYRKSTDGRMEPNPETAAVVQLIFQLAATGIGAAAVTRELFKRGIPTPGEYKAAHGQQYHDVSRSRGRWSSSTVLRILEDERYIGSYVIGRRAVIEVGGTRSRRKDRDKWFIIPDHHPAIVDKELFEKVQAVQRRFSLPTKKNREYPLKGKVYCGCCDHALSRIVQKRPFYMCRHSTADVNSRCRDVRADAAGLEEAVLLTLKKQLEILLPVHEDGTIHLEATVAKCSEYEKQLEALRDQKQSLFERYLLGQIELDTYKSEKAVYDAEILKVKNAYAAVTAQAKLKREEQARQSSRQEIVHSIAEADVLTSELTDLLIEKVYVFPDNRIEIVYKIHDLFE